MCASIKSGGDASATIGDIRDSDPATVVSRASVKRNTRVSTSPQKAHPFNAIGIISLRTLKLNSLVYGL